MNEASARVAAGQIVGARERQEDALAFRALGDGDGRFALVLADGMGGHAGGNVAANAAVGAFLERVTTAGEPATALKPALDAANESIRVAAAKDRKLEGMGATLVGAVVDGDRLSWISVGDLPMFLLRDGLLSRLNADHSMRSVLAQLVEAGRMTADEAAHDSSRNALRSALSGDEISLIDQSRLAQLLKPGDVLLLASDGLDTLETAKIAALAKEAAARGPQAIVDVLLKAVEGEKRERQDNASIVAYLHGDSAPASVAKVPAKSAAVPISLLVTALVIGLGVLGYFLYVAPTYGLWPSPAKPPIKVTAPAKGLTAPAPAIANPAAAPAETPPPNAAKPAKAKPKSQPQKSQPASPKAATPGGP